MEESLSLLAQLKKEFACKEVDIKTYSPLTLAYIGDAIFDLIIRTVIVERGNRSPNSLHKTASKFVKAETQSKIVEVWMNKLTEAEMAVFKRGRNAKSYTSAKNASIADYRRATGLEAVIGYLYLLDNMPRIIELVKLGIEEINMEV